MSDVNISIVSGRSVDNVKAMVGIPNLTYAGNHGLEILHPDGTKFVHPMPRCYEDKVSNLLKELQEEVGILNFKEKIISISLRTSNTISNK
jgi:trehalose-phosphatase